MKVLGCHGGLTNQRRGVEHLLQTMRRILPQLPEGVDFVLVAPSVWPAFYPPIPPGLDTTYVLHSSPSGLATAYG